MTIRSPNGEVIGQKVKGHGSKMRSFWGIFGFKKKLGSHRSEFGSAILDLGPLNKYKKTHRNKILNFWLFFEKMSKNSQKWRISRHMSKSVNFLIVLSSHAAQG